MQRQPRKRFRYSTGMERYLNKRVLVASATGFQDPKRGGWEPMDFSEEKLESVGRNWVYIFNRRRAKTEIPFNKVPLGLRAIIVDDFQNHQNLNASRWESNVSFKCFGVGSPFVFPGEGI